MFSKKPLIVVALLGLIIFTHDLSNMEMVYAAGPFQIRIFTDKVEYFTREPISVRYEVKNITDSTIYLVFNDVKESFSIKDQSGREYVNIMTSDYFCCPDTLKPNETLKGSEGIDSRYQIQNAGEYSCFIHFCGSKSNLLKILIKEPTGDEKKALGLYLDAEKLSWSQDKDPQKRELGFDKYVELADKYPNSIYAPQSLASAILVYFYSPNLEERRKIIPVCKRLIEEYPNSYYFMSVFTELIDTYEILKDRASAVATMNELIAKHPDTKISEEAKRRLEQVEKWKF